MELAEREVMQNRLATIKLNGNAFKDIGGGQFTSSHLKELQLKIRVVLFGVIAHYPSRIED